jgi:hypothetical protein
MKGLYKAKIVCDASYIPKVQYTHKPKQVECKNCKHFQKNTQGCNAFSIVNHLEKVMIDVDAALCREKYNLCSPLAFFFEDEIDNNYNNKNKQVSVETVPVPEDYVIQYFIDGSSTFSNASTVSIDEYYDNIHIEFNDVY